MNRPYPHTYGGTALDVEVTAPSFAHAFGFRESELAGLPTDMKVGDVVEHRGEILGYVRIGADGCREFHVTLIARPSWVARSIRIGEK